MVDSVVLWNTLERLGKTFKAQAAGGVRGCMPIRETTPPAQDGGRGLGHPGSIARTCKTFASCSSKDRESRLVQCLAWLGFAAPILVLSALVFSGLLIFSAPCLCLFCFFFCFSLLSALVGFPFAFSFHVFWRFCVFDKSVIDISSRKCGNLFHPYKLWWLHSLNLTTCTWKPMVGRQTFPFGVSAFFKGLCWFREGKGNLWLISPDHKAVFLFLRVGQVRLTSALQNFLTLKPWCKSDSSQYWFYFLWLKKSNQPNKNELWKKQHQTKPNQPFF